MYLFAKIKKITIAPMGKIKQFFRWSQLWLCIKQSRNFWFYSIIFWDGQSNIGIQFYLGLFLVAMGTKFETKWAITQLV